MQDAQSSQSMSLSWVSSSAQDAMRNGRVSAYLPLHTVCQRSPTFLPLMLSQDVQGLLLMLQDGHLEKLQGQVSFIRSCLAEDTLQSYGTDWRKGCHSVQSMLSHESA